MCKNRPKISINNKLSDKQIHGYFLCWNSKTKKGCLQKLGYLKVCKSKTCITFCILINDISLVALYNSFHPVDFSELAK